MNKLHRGFIIEAMMRRVRAYAERLMNVEEKNDEWLSTEFGAKDLREYCMRIAERYIIDGGQTTGESASSIAERLIRESVDKQVTDTYGEDFVLYAMKSVLDDLLYEW